MSEFFIHNLFFQRLVLYMVFSWVFLDFIHILNRTTKVEFMEMLLSLGKPLPLSDTTFNASINPLKDLSPSPLDCLFLA